MCIQMTRVRFDRNNVSLNFQNDVMSLSFGTLSTIEETAVVHDAAADVVCTLLVRLEDASAPSELKKCFLGPNLVLL